MKYSLGHSNFHIDTPETYVGVSGTISLSSTSTHLVVTPASYSPSTDMTLHQTLGGKRTPLGPYLFPKYYWVLNTLRRTFPNFTSTPGVTEWELGNTISTIQVDHPKFRDLYTYQMDAVYYLLQSTLHGTLLSLSPRLGKSVVSIIASEILEAKKVLVICPLLLISQWRDQYLTWTGKEHVDPEDVTTLHGFPKNYHIWGDPGWYITNYDTVSRHPSEFVRDWDLVIIDESILVKTRGIQRVKSLKKIVPQAKRLWLLSGSPSSRYIDDLWQQFNLIDPQTFSSYWRFANLYTIVEQTPWGSSVIGSKDIDFRSEFRDIMYVKNEREIGILPPPEYLTLEVPLIGEQKDMYNHLKKDLILQLESGEELTVSSKLALLTRLQQVVSGSSNVDPDTHYSCKRAALVELIQSGNIEFPLLIWTYWKAESFKIQEALGEKYRTWVINGDTPDEDRKTFLQEYLDGKAPILILSQSVGKFGLTLPNTKTVVYYDKTFQMDDYIQSQYRTRILGATSTARVITLRCPGTTDDIVAGNLIGKAIDVAKLTNSDLRALLLSLGKETVR